MKINLTTFQVEFLESGSIRFTMSTLEREKDDKYNTFYVISHNEIPLMLDCMTGKSKIYPYFDDGLYHIKIHPYGIRSLEKHSDKFKEYWFNIPLCKLDVLIEWINEHYQDSKLHMGRIYILTSENLKRLKFEFRDRIKFIYHDLIHTTFKDGQFHDELELKLWDKIKTDINSNPELLDNIKSLKRIAHNYATDKPITINLTLDSYQDKNYAPSSYYFYIMTEDNKRIMNGGIIAHKNNDDSYHYSMHT